MRTITARATLVAGVLASTALACNTSTGPANSQPVAFHLALAPHPALGGVHGPLSISAFQLVTGPAALGSGDQFGCVDCQNSGPESAPAPQLLTVPLDGSAVMVTTEPVGAGQYSAAEIGLLTPDRRLLSTMPSWPDTATVEVTGTYNGTPFTLDLAIHGSFRETLATPVVVTGGAPTSLDVTVTLPVATWFSAGSASLDPTNAADRARIEQNARQAFQAPEVGSGALRTP